MRILKVLKSVWKKIKHWCCKVGLCNLDKCQNDIHPKELISSQTFSSEQELPPTSGIAEVFPPPPQPAPSILRLCKTEGCDNMASLNLPEASDFPGHDPHLCTHCDPVLRGKL